MSFSKNIAFQVFCPLCNNRVDTGSFNDSLIHEGSKITRFKGLVNHVRHKHTRYDNEVDSRPDIEKENIKRKYTTEALLRIFFNKKKLVEKEGFKNLNLILTVELESYSLRYDFPQE